MSFWVLMALRMDDSFWANCNLEAPGIRLRILPLKQPGLIEGGDVGATDGVEFCWRAPLRVAWGERDAVEEFGPGGDIELVYEPHAREVQRARLYIYIIYISMFRLRDQFLPGAKWTRCRPCVAAA